MRNHVPPHFLSNLAKNTVHLLPPSSLADKDSVTAIDFYQQLLNPSIDSRRYMYPE